MFERTALASGPRVISARVPGRALGLHRRVRPGRIAPRDRRRDRRRPLHGTHHVQGHGRVPDHARDQRGHRGRRRVLQRRDRPRVDRVLGARPAARDRARRGRARRADRPSDARRRARSRASARSSSRRSARTSTTRPSTARSSSRTRCSATGRWAARSAATRPASARCPRTPIRSFWRAAYRPANTVVAVAGDLEHDGGASSSSAAAFGTGQRDGPGVRRRRRCCPPASGSRSASAARHRRRSGPRPAGAAPRPPRQLDARRPQRRPRRRDEQPPVPVRARGASAWPTTSRRGSSTTRTPARWRSRPGSIPTASGDALEAILASSPACVTSPYPTTS